MRRLVDGLIFVWIILRVFATFTLGGSFFCRFSPCKCNAYQWFSMCPSDAVDMAAVVAV